MRQSIGFIFLAGAFLGTGCGAPKAIEGDTAPPSGHVLPVGELLVEGVWTHPWAPTEFVTRLLPPTVPCVSAGAGGTSVVEREQHHPPQAPASFTELPAGSRWTVYVFALGARGAVVADGCEAGVEVWGEQTHSVTVTLARKFGAPFGVYDVEMSVAWEHLAGESALEGGLAPVLELLEDPAAALTNFWLDALVDAGVAPTRAGVAQAIELAWFAYVMIGGHDINGDGTVNVADADTGGPVGVEVTDPIRHLLYRDAGAVDLGEVRSLLDSVTLGGALSIDRASEEEVLATWFWDRLTWEWPAGDLEHMQAVPYGLPTGSASFWAEVRTRDDADGVSWEIDVPSHDLPMPVAPWVERAVTEPLVYRVSGQPNLACAIEAKLGCVGTQSFVCGTSAPGCGCQRAADALQSVGVLGESARAACLDVISRASTTISERLRQALHDAVGAGGLRGEGTLTLADDDGDLRGDELQGTMNGEFWSAGEPMPVQMHLEGQKGESVP